MLLQVARVAVAALVGSITYNTGRNVYETVQIVSKERQQLLPPLLPTLLQSQPLPQSVSELQKLSRQEIIHLYLHYCTAVPSDLIDIEGEWNGALLHNNGLVGRQKQELIHVKIMYALLTIVIILLQTRITRFITNRLFGKGRRWNGKSFDAVVATSDTMITSMTSVDNNVDTSTSLNDTTNVRSSNSETTGSGWNRFEVLTQYRTSHKNDIRRRKKTSKTATTTKSTTVILKTEKEHLFGYKLDPSRLYPHESSICLDYTNSQSKLSLWKGMKDELRVLPISPNPNSMNKYDILIGLGSLSWSGGIYNCSPFCLYRKCK
jgi:hypothetical protein